MLNPIWNGPGVSVRGPDGVQYPPAHLDPTQTAGRFIDWPRGPVSDRSTGLQRLEVTFYVGVPREPNRLRRYVVAYEVDPSASIGFIYLPRWTNNLISHGVEGNWFHASKQWNDLIAPLIAAQTTHFSNSVQPGKLSCIAGYGSLGADGTIEFKLFDEQGNKISHWRYDKSTEGYESVREHIGDVEPGEQIEISCWPPRS